MRATTAGMSKLNSTYVNVMASSSPTVCSKYSAVAEALMVDVYGDWKAEFFPKPLPPDEAGPGGHNGHQRRYLWTDAFGVLNFISLSKGFPGRSSEFLGAAGKLIKTVHETLGTPRSIELPMLTDPDRPGYYKGLRIGKLHARASSDAGMKLDGMYWHYVDKWLFALIRYHQATRSAEALDDALRLVTNVHPYFCVPGQGVRWKLNADMKPIAGLEEAHPNHDAETAYIIYNVLDGLRPGQVDKEIADLTGPFRAYLQVADQHVSSDPLGYGLTWWTNQFLRGPMAERERAALVEMAPYAIDRRYAKSLPFRLYGALLGARISGVPSIVDACSDLIERLIPVEMSVGCGEVEHSAINKVMLAAALCPGEWTKREDDPSVV
ncbi:hypothetical protein FOZ62_024627 [Perkinsus olseni]|uniref:Uncharacterized protein n=1 Tax=Perkinsus olseni TaxID=32597 RepID=A0A7J6QIC8_PEROL|nr:hypothetical protein FOZ62_024627 [Perkinsus olseni]